jgi:ketosteroid isomerase-like protein
MIGGMREVGVKGLAVGLAAAALMSISSPCPAQQSAGGADAAARRDLEAVEAVTTQYLEALNTAELDALLAAFLPGATAFVPQPTAPDRLEGLAGLRGVFEPFFARVRASGSGPRYMNLVARDVQINLLGDVAVVTFHLGELPPPGSGAAMFSRRTLVVARDDDRWGILHLHASQVLAQP